MTVQTRVVPAGLVASLRTAFAAERDERVPALRAALAHPDAPTADARRAAHALGSSAYVVGEPDLGALARDVEARLDAGRAWHEQGRQLLAALESWAS